MILDITGRYITVERAFNFSNKWSDSTCFVFLRLLANTNQAFPFSEQENFRHVA